MLQKITTFWNNFWYALKDTYNKIYVDVPKENVQSYNDTEKINLLAIFVDKLNSIANIEATFDVESDSEITARLKKLCKDLEAKRYEITGNMLGDGDCYIFPSHGETGELYHRIVTQNNVRILGLNGNQINDIIGIVDEYVDNYGHVYLLNRRHTLVGNELLIETYITDDKNYRVDFEEWQSETGTFKISNATSIGIGRFKSPASSRGKSIIYGVPLNFGCSEIEEKIFADLKDIEEEFKNSKSKIFADPLILRKGKDRIGNDNWKIPESIFPIDSRSNQGSSSMTIFSPAIRYSEHRQRLIDDMTQYEQMVGTDKGFLTPVETTNNATATEIRRANSSTRATIEKIHESIKNGIRETIKADAMYLNIPDDMYNLKIDFYDAFEVEEEQYKRLANAVDRGIAEKEDELQWLFPNLTKDEISEKLARISATQKTNTDQALERILSGQ